MHVKIVEITPQLEFIGDNIEETVRMQKEHEHVYRKLQVNDSSITKPNMSIRNNAKIDIDIIGSKDTNRGVSSKG